MRGGPRGFTPGFTRRALLENSSGDHSRFAYGAVTLFGLAFQPARLRGGLVTPCRCRNNDPGSLNPDRATLTGYHTRSVWAMSLFARRYWGSRCLFPFLQVLRWVSSAGLASITYVFSYGWYIITHTGFPHSDISGSLPLPVHRSFSQVARPTSPIVTGKQLAGILSLRPLNLISGKPYSEVTAAFLPSSLRIYHSFVLVCST